jgi:hypothetical protein
MDTQFGKGPADGGNGAVESRPESWDNKKENVMKRLAIVALLLLPCGMVWADGDDEGLLFTPLKAEQSAQFPSGSGALNSVLGKEVQYVVPVVTWNPDYDYVSWQWATFPGYNFCCGDFDDDAYYFESFIWGKIDAVMRPRTKSGFPVELKHMRQLFISPRQDYTSAVPAGPPFTNTLRMGDVGRIVTAGRVEIFLTEEHVRKAFNIPKDQEINIDAVALHLDKAWSPDAQGIYLSLEKDHDIVVDSGAYLAQDGAILRIPRSRFTTITSTYDGVTFLVDDVAYYGCGELILNEAEVNSMLVASGFHGPKGNAVQQIGDLDGLTPHNGNGYFINEYTGTPVHHLWFSGRRMRGGGIVSTAGGGTIPVMNGVAMGNDQNAPPPPYPRTTGRAVGLVPGDVESLDGLSRVSSELPHFVLDSTTPEMPAIGTIRVEIGGADVMGVPSPLTYLGWSMGVNTPHGVDVGSSLVPLNGAYDECFPPLIFDPLCFIPAPIDPATGCYEWVYTVPAWLYSYLVGNNMLFQAYSFEGLPPYFVSAPMKIQF